MSTHARISVGARVRSAMAASGLTQEELADKLGFHQSQVSRRLTGQVPWDVDELAALARIFDCSLTDLVSEEPAAA